METTPHPVDAGTALPVYSTVDRDQLALALFGISAEAVDRVKFEAAFGEQVQAAKVQLQAVIDQAQALMQSMEGDA